MPHPLIVTRWQNSNERWAQRRSAELGLPYEPLWPPAPEAHVEPDDILDEVIRQWAGMNSSERAYWGEVYPELGRIPPAMLEKERARLARMRDAELELRLRGRITTKPTPATDESFRLTSAAEVAEQNRKKRKKAS